jgi:P27 family predicted phage terminase small subunit
MGRPPDPPALRLLKGETRPSRTKRTAPAVPSKVPAPPKSMSPVALAEWKRLAPTLAADGRLTELTAAGFACFCDDYALLREAQALIDEFGLLIPQGSGIPKVNPACSIAHDAAMSMLKWAQLYGLTPASRARMNLPEPEEEDELERLLRGPIKRRPPAKPSGKDGSQ